MSDRYTLKYFHDEYIGYKERELTNRMDRKGAELEYLYGMYAEIYNHEEYLHDNMMEAIDMGETSFVVFSEYESIDISLWATDLINLFTKDSAVCNRWSLQSILARQLSEEFRFTVDCEDVIDRRDNSKYQRVIARVSWTS